MTALRVESGRLAGGALAFTLYERGSIPSVRVGAGLLREEPIAAQAIARGFSRVHSERRDCEASIRALDPLLIAEVPEVELEVLSRTFRQLL